MVPAGLSLSRARLGPSVITQPTALRVCVEGGSSVGRGWAGLGWRDCDSPPHQPLLDVLMINLPFPVGCASARVQPVVNTPQNAIRQEKDREGRWLKRRPSFSHQTRESPPGPDMLGYPELRREAHPSPAVLGPPLSGVAQRYSYSTLGPAARGPPPCRLLTGAHR